MRRNEPRGRLLTLTLLILGAALLAQVLGGLAGLVLLGAVLLGVVWDLARHLEDLTDLPADSPKWKPLRWVTAFDAALVLVCVGAALLAETGHLPWTEAGERYFAAALDRGRRGHLDGGPPAGGVPLPSPGPGLPGGPLPDGPV